MIEINGKNLCENCFEEVSGASCKHCEHDPAAAERDLTALPAGTVLVGKYVIGKVMGRGGFGVTYLAYDVAEQKKVAVKEFFPYGVVARATGDTTVSVAAADKSDIFKTGAEKFYNEAKLVSTFNGNPDIVSVYGFFYENGTAYFSMEYLQGHTLKEHVQQYGVLNSAQALFVAQSVSNALVAAHSSSVLHRDISPDNIIICDNGEVKLIDFGAARQVVAERSQTFSVILKPGFAPLEQYQKKGKQGPWTDIYSLGATLYYILTEDILDDPMSRMDDDEEYRSNKHGIHPELWSIISKATELRIEDRYEDILLFRKDLLRISFEAEPLVAPQSPEPISELPEAQSVQPAIDEHQTQYVPDAPKDTTAPVKTKKKRPAVIAAICGAVAVIAAAIIIIVFGNAAVENVVDKECVLPDGTTIIYTGEWANGMPEGQGKATYEYGDDYEGEWVNGKHCGQGVMTYYNGDVYEGEWENDKRNGQGKATYANGSVYDGNWMFGMRHGQGLMTYYNGDVYEGQWRNDIRSYGKYTSAEGSVYVGLDVYEGYIYKGGWGSDDLPDGAGKLTILYTGRSFTGSWSHGKCGDYRISPEK